MRLFSVSEGENLKSRWSILPDTHLFLNFFLCSPNNNKSYEHNYYDNYLSSRSNHFYSLTFWLVLLSSKSYTFCFHYAHLELNQPKITASWLSSSFFYSIQIFLSRLTRNYYWNRKRYPLKERLGLLVLVWKNLSLFLIKLSVKVYSSQKIQNTYNTFIACNLSFFSTL